MMAQFTWQHFILFILSIGLPYYLVVLLLYFRRDIRLRISRKTSVLHYDPGGDAGINLMGCVREEPGLHIIDAQELNFAQPDLSTDDEHLDAENDGENVAWELSVSARSPNEKPALPGAQVTDMQIMGDIADFLRDMNTLFSMSAEAGKEEFISLFNLITSRYQKLTESHLLQVVNLFILEQAKEKLPFEFSSIELEKCWQT